jgi:hypothetical protein
MYRMCNSIIQKSHNLIKINSYKNTNKGRFHNALDKSATILARKSPNSFQNQPKSITKKILIKNIGRVQSICRVQKHPTQPETDGATKIAENLRLHSSPKEIQTADPLRIRPISNKSAMDGNISLNETLPTELPDSFQNRPTSHILPIKKSDFISYRISLNSLNSIKTLPVISCPTKMRLRKGTQIFIDSVEPFNINNDIYKNKSVQRSAAAAAMPPVQLFEADSPPKLRLRPSPTHLEHSGIGLDRNNNTNSYVLYKSIITYINDYKYELAYKLIDEHHNKLNNNDRDNLYEYLIKNIIDHDKELLFIINNNTHNLNVYTYEQIKLHRKWYLYMFSIIKSNYRIVYDKEYADVKFIYKILWYSMIMWGIIIINYEITIFIISNLYKLKSNSI